ncbi:MAG TPA: dihydroneopterin aldolase [Woeseiaceae bacterium]|jgi:dihydroneopterin aldolase
MSAGTDGDFVFLRGLEVEAVIGIWEWERRIRQKVRIDLEMGVDIPRAAAGDRIEDTLNYKSVAKRVQEFVGASSFQLVETLAERIAELVLTEFAVPWIRITVNKPGAIRGARDVGVCIRRRGTERGA